jgi:hypothetical protein
VEALFLHRLSFLLLLASVETPLSTASDVCLSSTTTSIEK